jgi:hypothetical protein
MHDYQDREIRSGSQSIAKCVSVCRSVVTITELMCLAQRCVRYGNLGDGHWKFYGRTDFERELLRTVIRAWGYIFDFSAKGPTEFGAAFFLATYQDATLRAVVDDLWEIRRSPGS